MEHRLLLDFDFNSVGYNENRRVIIERKMPDLTPLKIKAKELSGLKEYNEKIAQWEVDLREINKVIINNNTSYSLFVDFEGKQSLNNVLPIIAKTSNQKFKTNGLKFVGPGFHFGYNAPTGLQPGDRPQVHTDLNWTSYVNTIIPPIALSTASNGYVRFSLEFKYFPPEGENDITDTGTVEITINKVE